MQGLEDARFNHGAGVRKGGGLYRAALLLGALSGCAALSHELLWTRRLIDLLGASSESSARVLGSFFLGLSLGSACGGWLVKRVRHPWKAMAIVEGGIAITTVPALMLPDWTAWLWPWLGPDRLISWQGGVVKLAVSLLVVLPPAFLMGLTLPLLAVACLGGNRTMGKQGVWLYAFNTVGGVAGLLGTTVLGLALLGVAGSMTAAMTLNLVVAASCLMLYYTSADSVPQHEDVPGKAPKRVDQQRKQSLSFLLLFLAFVSGAGVLGIEVLSIHLFSHVAPSAIHGAAAVLASLILLLAASAFLVPFLTRGGVRPARELMPMVMGGAGIATAAGPLLFMWITGGMITIKPSASVTLFMLKTMGFVLCSLGPCLLLTGLVFPLLFSWLEIEGGNGHGRRWGWLLAVNGLGGLVGVEIAQRLAMPLGMHVGLGLFGFGYALLAVVMAITNEGKAFLNRSLVWRQVGATGLVIVMIVVWLVNLPLIHTKPTKTLEFKTLAISGGPEGIVAVNQDKNGHLNIVMFNQYMLGGTGGLYDEQRQAHLPIMLHPNPRNVAFIALATGITASGALMHDNVESVTVIELSKQVTDAARAYFGKYTNGIFTDFRAKVVVEDGRTYIAACRERFDLVISDLFLPWQPGTGRLYSIEHFQAARGSLRQGGMFCQMLPMFQVNEEQCRVILATMLQVFPHVHLFKLGFETDTPVLALVATTAPVGELDWQGLPQRCERLRRAGKVLDPVMRHADTIAMLYLGRIDQGDQPVGTINTLGNVWVELNAGHDFITNQWRRPDGYFLTHERWIAFESRVLSTAGFADKESETAKRLAWLGHKMSQWSDACLNKDPDANQLGRELYQAMPTELKEDSRADPSVWEGWKVFIKPAQSAKEISLRH